MDNSYVLAFDTSNYTTSLAILDIRGGLVANLKRILNVKPGERGLRQSDAVFAHTVNIPILMEEAKPFLSKGRVVAIGVSEKPRNAEGSYMPCFLVGVSVAESVSAVTGAPIFRFSHQCGHIMAALYSCGRSDCAKDEFAAFHISGGTTELVKVKPVKNGFETELVGGTRDLNAGQVIDRIGVLMGLPFPSGKYMEELALSNKKRIPKSKVSSVGREVNLSGLENMAAKLYKDSGDRALTSAFVFNHVGRAIYEMSRAYEEEYGKTEFVYAGGVMCNSIIKKMLSSSFNAVFAEPSMSSDNAVGTAALTLRSFKEN